MIVTFSCSDDIYIYEPNCGRMPMHPFTAHESISDAINWLQVFRCITIPNIVTYKTLTLTV